MPGGRNYYIVNEDTAAREAEDLLNITELCR